MADEWSIFGRKVPKNIIVYFVQVFVVFILIVTAVVNLSINNGPDKLWTSVLTSAIAYLIPAPSFDINNNNNNNKQQQQQD